MSEKFRIILRRRDVQATTIILKKTHLTYTSVT